MSNQAMVKQISNRDSARANAIPQNERELVEVSQAKGLPPQTFLHSFFKKEEKRLISVGSFFRPVIVDKAPYDAISRKPHRKVGFCIRATVLP